MAQVRLDDSTLVNIANKIREKTQETISYKPSEMPEAIDRIKQEAPTIESLEVTSNGTYEVEEGIDGYNPITVNVPPTLQELTVSENGTYTAPDMIGYSPVTVNIPDPPTSELEVTENGTYEVPEDIYGYTKVVVNTPITIPNIEALEITENGTYTASECDGYSPITVNVPQDGGPPEEAFLITGDCSYMFYYGKWDWFINQYGNQITTNDISIASNMFHTSKVNVPFELNFKSTSDYTDTSKIFYSYYGTSIPKMNNLKPYNISEMFASATHIRDIPQDLSDTWDWSLYINATSGTSCKHRQMFTTCYSLRRAPVELLKYGNPNISYSNSCYYQVFSSCCALDEIIDLPVPHTNAKWTGNAFLSSFDRCYRLKNMTFATQEDGSPYVVSWKSQTIDLSSVGWIPVRNDTYILNFNSGITEDKRVHDDESYQALKNDPDWYAYCTLDEGGLGYTSKQYSRYNHDAAVATINSLPDTSAYLATAGGTNTIKFTGAVGEKTDGGAINTLTEEEIAVATAKGWTVTLS